MRNVAVGAVRIEKDIRFELPPALEASCALGDTVVLNLECSYEETSRDRELVRVMLRSDVPDARPVLFDFHDRPGIRDRVTSVLAHRVAAREPGTLAAHLRIHVEVIRQPWTSQEVVGWDRAERAVPFTLRVG